MEKFNDEKLINLARYNWYKTKAEKRPEISDILQKEILNNNERNALINFISETKYSGPLSIKSMKEEIFEIMGLSEEISNPNPTINRKELEAIYNFMKNIKNEK